jgi:hypothetical protein
MLLFSVITPCYHPMIPSLDIASSHVFIPCYNFMISLHLIAPCYRPKLSPHIIVPCYQPMHYQPMHSSNVNTFLFSLGIISWCHPMLSPHIITPCNHPILSSHLITMYSSHVIIPCNRTTVGYQ